MSFAPRELSPARLGRNVHLVLARHPWVRWLAVGVVAAAAGASVHAQLQSIEAARAQWTDQQRVPVATAAASPGDELSWEWRNIPAVGVPDGVARDIFEGIIARQRVGTGEIIVDADLTVGSGPAAGAASGHVVVPVSDPLVTDPSVGIDVAIYSDGLVLADEARVVHVDGSVVYVEVDAAAAPMVAAAAQTRQASIAFVAPR
jgi:hypothetical protein